MLLQLLPEDISQRETCAGDFRLAPAVLGRWATFLSQDGARSTSLGGPLRIRDGVPLSPSPQVASSPAERQTAVREAMVLRWRRTLWTRLLFPILFRVLGVKVQVMFAIFLFLLDLFVICNPPF